MGKLIFFLLIVATVGFFGYRYIKGDPNQVPELKEIGIVDSDGFQRATFQVEVAKRLVDKTKGLMFRESMPIDQGMIFVYDRDLIRKMWMKNTKISLDMIFIDTFGQIVEIVKNTEPGSTTSIGREPSRYVLEINAGLVDEYGITLNNEVIGLEEL